MKKIITLLFSVSLLGASAQCVMTGFASAGSCDVPTNTYTATGTFFASGAPATGILNIVNSCGGSQAFPAPFTGPVTFNFPGLTANGASCTVIGNFSDDPGCIYTTMYTAPVACGATSVVENTFLANLTIAPNPSSGSINLSFEQAISETLSIEIVDVLGRSVYTKNLPKFTGSYNKQIDLTPFNKGVYFVRITGESNSEIKKIIYY